MSTYSETKIYGTWPVKFFQSLSKLFVSEMLQKCNNNNDYNTIVIYDGIISF